MSTRARVVAIWTAALALIVLVFAIAAQPMAVAWRCYELAASGERAPADVVHKLERPTLVLQIAAGPHTGHACTARTSAAHHDALEIGDSLPIVYHDDRPDECVLVATLENSAYVLAVFAVGIASIVLLLVAGALLAHRSLTAAPFLTSFMQVDGKRMTCPVCDLEMEEGYLPLLSGLHWRDPGEPVGMPHALSGLPGTVGWRTRPRLHAFRCPTCEVVTLQYGTERVLR